ncbi:hypothetical protein [Williamsia soli]|uniref:hypothetical protein n=1 Tax=Williamsia soli TaxID=364929 RepID=UPI001A9E391A|nr:hypothetical protein [Williamsia soli]
MGTPLAAMPPEDDQQRWYRRPLWLILLTAIVVAALVAAVVAITGGDNDDAAPPPATAPSTPSASNGQDGYLPDTVDRFGQQIRVPRDPAGLALPQRPVTSQRGLNDAAVGLQWQRLYGFGAAVFSTSDGPRSISPDGLAEGIAQTPQGSVIAASQIMARAYYGPPEVRMRVLAQQVIGPESAKQMIRDLTMPDRQYALDRFVKIDEQYSDTFSRISLATGPKPNSDYPSGQYYGVSTFVMVWDDGQWKWRIPDDGFTTATGDTRTESVAGWTQWQ